MTGKHRKGVVNLGIFVVLFLLGALFFAAKLASNRDLTSLNISSKAAVRDLRQEDKPREKKKPKSYQECSGCDPDRKGFKFSWKANPITGVRRCVSVNVKKFGECL